MKSFEVYSIHSRNNHHRVMNVSTTLKFPHTLFQCVLPAPPCYPTKWLLCFLSPYIIWNFPNIDVSEVIWHVLFFSFGMAFNTQHLSHLTCWVYHNSPLFIAEYYFIVYPWLFEGHVGCFQILAIINKVTMSIFHLFHVFVRT